MDTNTKIISNEQGNELIGNFTGIQGNYRFDAALWKVLFESLMSAPVVIYVTLQFTDGGGSFMIRYYDKNHQYPDQVLVESWNFDQPFTTPEHAVWFVSVRMIHFLTTGKLLALKIE